MEEEGENWVLKRAFIYSTLRYPAYVTYINVTSETTTTLKSGVLARYLGPVTDFQGPRVCAATKFQIATANSGKCRRSPRCYFSAVLVVFVCIMIALTIIDN